MKRLRTISHNVPTAADIMRRKLITLTPKTPIFEAIRVLLKNQISGAPVLDGEGHLVGICSERDCLRILSAGEFYADDHREEGNVADVMTTEFVSAAPTDDIYRLAHYFLTHAVRRLPVLENGELIGQLSRRDVLKAIEAQGDRKAHPRKYPDYREPSEEVGARRAH